MSSLDNTQTTPYITRMRNAESIQPDPIALAEAILFALDELETEPEATVSAAPAIVSAAILYALEARS